MITVAESPSAIGVPKSNATIRSVTANRSSSTWSTITIVVPPLLELADLLGQDRPLVAVEPAEGLVEQQQVGAFADRAGEVGTLLQAERQLARVALGHVGETDASQQLARRHGARPCRRVRRAHSRFSVSVSSSNSSACWKARAMPSRRRAVARRLSRSPSW